MKPGVLWFRGLQRVRHDLATELELDWVTNTKVGEGEREYAPVCARACTHTGLNIVVVKIFMGEVD